jgi:hypothetical protein
MMMVIIIAYAIRFSYRSQRRLRYYYYYYYYSILDMVDNIISINSDNYTH